MSRTSYPKLNLEEGIHLLLAIPIHKIINTYIQRTNYVVFLPFPFMQKWIEEANCSCTTLKKGCENL